MMLAYAGLNSLILNPDLARELTPFKELVDSLIRIPERCRLSHDAFQ
jgi:hypothetical protein